MALVVFLRGINVGGHRHFRPAQLAKQLAAYDVVNVGAAGTLVVRNPGLRRDFIAELHRKLPFEAEITFCGGRDLMGLETENPFATEPSRRDLCERAFESRSVEGFSSDRNSRGPGVVCTDYRIAESACIWTLPAPHENHRLSGPDRQSVRCDGDDTQLEHNPFSAPHFESALSRLSILLRPRRTSNNNTCTCCTTRPPARHWPQCPAHCFRKASASRGSRYRRSSNRSEPP